MIKSNRPTGNVVKKTIWGALALTAAALVTTTGTVTATSAAAAARPAAAPEFRAGSATDVITTTRSYGADPQQTVQLSRSIAFTGPRPTVYFVHGGGWVGGTAKTWQATAKTWAARGWVAVNVSYRRKVDGRLELADLQTVLDKYGAATYVDRTRQILVGDSAGAHLAIYEAAHAPKYVAGVVAWSPVVVPYNAYTDGTAPTASPAQVTLAAEAASTWSADWRTSSALRYVSAKTPPMWLAASQNEFVRWDSQGALLCAALGSRCTSHVVAGEAHGKVIAQQSPLLSDEALAWAESRVG